ncbi:hypothetical protein C8R47DRAFT_1079073 [Mycena vitilis]|nr:hypothetical protein C8R47DRAFT_1079073 [Mycena vitilis]
MRNEDGECSGRMRELERTRTAAGECYSLKEHGRQSPKIMVEDEKGRNAELWRASTLKSREAGFPIENWKTGAGSAENLRPETPAIEAWEQPSAQQFTLRGRQCSHSQERITGSWSAQNILSQKYANLSPRAIMFDAFDNTKDRDIFAFGLHNNGPVGPSGDATVNWREGILCLDDPASGPTLFRLTDRSKRPRGGLRVQTRTGDLLQKLEANISQWVQAVAAVQAADIDGVPVIFAALTRADGGDVLVRIVPGVISANSDAGARQDVGTGIHKDVVYL